NKQDLPIKFAPEDFLYDIKANKYKNINSMFTSAKHGEGILDCFETILQLILKKYYKNKLINIIN
ncbi:unnamed protein product, partial [marine sediment metagenome]